MTKEHAVLGLLYTAALGILGSHGCPQSTTVVPPVVPDATADASINVFDAGMIRFFDSSNTTADVVNNIQVDPVVTICNNLNHVGCHEGIDADCVKAFHKLIDSKVTKIDQACLLGVKSQMDVRNCGQGCTLQ